MGELRDRGGGRVRLKAGQGVLKAGEGFDCIVKKFQFVFMGQIDDRRFL